MLQRATDKSKHNLGTKLYISYGENIVIVLFKFFFFVGGGGGYFVWEVNSFSRWTNFYIKIVREVSILYRVT